MAVDLVRIKPVISVLTALLVTVLKKNLLACRASSSAVDGWQGMWEGLCKVFGLLVWLDTHCSRLVPSGFIYFRW